MDETCFSLGVELDLLNLRERHRVKEPEKKRWEESDKKGRKKYDKCIMKNYKMSLDYKFKKISSK
jgi:hypothetical protein